MLKDGVNPTGDDSGFRVAFIDEGLKKIRIFQNEMSRGKKVFCLETEPGRWYNSLEQMIDDCKSDSDTKIRQQFDLNDYSSKSIFRNHSMSSPDISASSTHNSLHPKRYSGPSGPRKIEGSRDISKSLNSLVDGNIDRVISNIPKVHKLLDGKDQGTYLIHEGKNNTYEQPYDVYFSEQSFKENISKLKIKKLYVHRDKYDRDRYYLSNDREIKFDSLKDLIIYNKVRFKMPLDDEDFPPSSQLDSRRQTRDNESILFKNIVQLPAQRIAQGTSTKFTGEYLDIHKKTRG